MLKPLLSSLLMVFALSLPAQTAAPLTSKAVFEKAAAASVTILTGEGAGRLRGIATGVLASEDGLVLTALHAVKGSSEVQIRLSNGEVFDSVQMLGYDDRRDVVALKIAASAMPFLEPGTTSSLAQGDPVYAVTSASGLPGSATSGIFSGTRPAEEVHGGGSGYRLLQFSAPVTPGASGGALVNQRGQLVGIITRGVPGGAAFAVPVESVLGLRTSGLPVLLGSGSKLEPPAKLAAAVPQSSAAVADADPKQLTKSARTVYIHSKTSFLTVDTVERALNSQKDWQKLQLKLVQDPRVADVLIEIDRPIFTYAHTFVISDIKTSLVLGSGKVTAFDGTIASGGLAKQIVKIFSAARLPDVASKK